jgi:2-polyprenyl-3-methyl-5-hydroxy-6-metoxy-1,4-benzoquinol methylase
MNWRDIAKDPNDKAAKKAVLDYLITRRKVVPLSKIDVFLEYSKDKAVMDIGICQGSLEYIKKESWKHRLISSCAQYTLGVDIDKDLIEYLKKNNFNVIHADATSDVKISDIVFDTIIVGDVIEHVDSPIKLLLFCKRHLSENGVVVVSTPNPFSWRFAKRIAKNKTYISNLEHTLWITPNQALEIGIRCNMKLTKYFITTHKTKLWEKILPAEISGSTYIYFYEHM